MKLQLQMLLATKFKLDFLVKEMACHLSAHAPERGKVNDGFHVTSFLFMDMYTYSRLLLLIYKFFIYQLFIYYLYGRYNPKLLQIKYTHL